MTNPTEIPSQQDDIKSVLQETLFQQVQTLLNFTRTEGFALQIPETETLILAGRAGKILEFTDKLDEQPLWDGNGEPWNEAAEKAERDRLASQSQAAQPTELTDEQIDALMNESGVFDQRWPTEAQYRQFARAAIAAHIAGTSQATKAQAEPEGFELVPKAFVTEVRRAAAIADSYSPSIDSIDEHGGEECEEPIWQIHHILFYAHAKLFAARKQFDIEPVASVAKEATRDAESVHAKELVEQLRNHHKLEIWDWDILLNAASMIERIATTTSTVSAPINETVKVLQSALAAAMDGEGAQKAPEEVRNQALEFANHIIESAFDGGDLGGGDVQDLAAQYGLLKMEVMTEPCGGEGSCRCAQGVPFFPTICYRKTYIDALRTSSTDQANADTGSAE